MKYKRIFKWELFAGISVIFAFNFILLSLFVDAILKNVLDREINSRLQAVGSAVENRLPELVFALNPEADRGTKLFSEYSGILEEFKNKWDMDLTVTGPTGRVCISTGRTQAVHPSVIESEKGPESVTYYENGVPQKSFVYPYSSGAGFIVMDLGKKPLAAFIEIRNRQFLIMAVLLAAGVLFSFGFSYIVTGRIDYTVREMEKISVGGAGTIKVSWIDEFSYLQERINEMVRRIKELQESKYREVQIAAMGLAHEIRNPAAAIFNLAELAQRNASDPAKVMHGLGKIKDEVTRLNIIVEKFIQFSRENKVNKENTELKTFFDGLAEGYEGLSVAADPQGIKAGIDPILMERAARNIIKNAYEAGAGRVDIQIQPSGKGLVSIRIFDDAALIKPETAANMFVPFYTTKSDGMGIGLAITKNIIEKHGGRIEYFAENGKNCFTINIPEV